jgi:hypothetical protein
MILNHIYLNTLIDLFSYFLNISHNSGVNILIQSNRKWCENIPVAYTWFEITDLEDFASYDHTALEDTGFSFPACNNTISLYSRILNIANI